MGEQVLKICGIALISAICGIVIGQIRKELSFAVKVAGVILIFGMIFTSLSPFLAEIEGLPAFGNISEYIQIMLKALGVAFLTHICATLCRDCGESSLASGVEFAGKLEILILCLPLISKILNYASQIISMGE